MDNLRDALVVAIREFSSDELTIEDWQEIAGENVEELVNRVFYILSWYHAAYNEKK